MLKINPDFESLIPPLSAEEYSGLEKSILEEGVREPIVVWTKCEFANPNCEHDPDPALTSETFIVDGHNRYKIATKYGLDFDTVEYDFEDEDAVKVWMIENQLSRRNLTVVDKALLAHEHAAIEQKYALQRMNAGKADPRDCSPKGRAFDVAGELFGVSGKTVQRIDKILQQPDSEIIISEIRRGNTSIAEADKQIREVEKKAERQAAIEEAKAQPRSSSYVDIFTTDKRYRVIYADPPWSYNDKQDTARLGGAEKHYHTMELDDICSIDVPTEKNAVLFLWATSPLLPEALAVITDWGFTYKSSFIWDKVSHSMGHYNSVRHEFLLIAVKGSCTPDVKKLHDSVVSIERTDHSRKPAYFRELIDELYPIGERIELFAREAPDGWDVWGDMA